MASSCSMYTTKGSPLLDPRIAPAVVSEVQDLIDKGEATGQQTGAWEGILVILTKNNLVLILQLPPEVVGVHPQNRSSLGVDSAAAQEHGDDILQAGYSSQKASDATCFECPPAEMAKEFEDFNENLLKESSGFLPPLSMLKYLSVGGSHTNTFLRQVNGGVPSAVPGLADSMGNLNFDSLSVGRASFAEACKKGMQWTVLHWQCAFQWPGLPHLVQEALNLHCKKSQTEIEIMLNLCNRRKNLLTNNMQVDWENWGKQLPMATPHARAT